MLKFKVGDKVKVLSGKDKGREGIIEAIYPKKGKALVPGINKFKRHIKKENSKDGKGGVMEFSRPIDLGKLAVIDQKSKKPTRIGFQVKGGKKLRISKSTGIILDKAK